MYLKDFFDIRVDQINALTINAINSPLADFQNFYGFGYDTDLNH